jgi:hypothetical protein
VLFGEVVFLEDFLHFWVWRTYSCFFFDDKSLLKRVIKRLAILRGIFIQETWNLFSGTKIIFKLIFAEFFLYKKFLRNFATIVQRTSTSGLVSLLRGRGL